MKETSKGAGTISPGATTTDSNLEDRISSLEKMMDLKADKDEIMN